jgi:cell division protein FtsA
MIKNNYTCGIDIGTHTTRVVVLGYNNNNKNISVLATGQAETDGMRRGYIRNTDQVANSIKKAIAQAEKILNFKIRKAFVSIGGISLTSTISIGSVIISRADQEITALDISKALSSSEEELDLLNKKIIHIIPIGYKLDGKDLYVKPEGMHGVKLEIKTLFITCLKQNIDDLTTAFALAKIDILDIIASPVADSLIILSNKQKAAGCALVNIGGETVSLAVFENNLLISLQIFPIGSTDITKDIALGLKISLEESESIKLGSVIGGNYSQKKIDEIIEARLNDIFELIENHLKKLRRNELLPAGIIFTGGGSYINKIEDLARNQLRLPSRIGPIDSSINNKFKIKDASWYTVFGLALSSCEDYSDESIKNLIGDNLKQVKSFLKSIFSQLLP